MSDARHTPAAQVMAETDMFGDVPLDSDTARASAHITKMQTFTGVLVRNPELRSTTAADGLHSTPVISLELRATGEFDKRICQAHISFTDATRGAAECWVKAHKKGDVLKVACDPLYTRLVLPQAQIINAYTPS